MLRIVMLALVVALAAGCSSNPKDDNANGAKVDERTANGSQDGAQSRGMSDGEGTDGSAMTDAQKYSMEQLDNPNSALSIRTIYFAYDSSEITTESQELLTEHARLLGYNPGTQIVLEGHTDERGTRDYNLALGERRSKAVHEFLTAQGVNPSQLEVISYGEERPVAFEHNESAWQLNRRVELIYPGK